MATAPTARQSSHHDIIAIGGSAGAVDALRTLLRDLDPALPTTVFIVVHVGLGSRLADVLAMDSRLPLGRASAGGRVQPGHVYVGVSGFHLMLHDDHMLLRRGPRENLSRPAVDPLFRSAAATFGGRVIGVVLSGALSDGTAGLRAIKRCGGLAVVQDPVDALVPAMPKSALRHVDVDHVCRMEQMGRLLNQLVRQPAGPTPEIPLDIRLETAIAAQELSDMRADDMLGAPSRFTCPECHGALWEIEDGSLLRYRCHVGHAFGAEAVLASQAEEVDRLLGTLLRSHQEHAALARRMAEHERRNDRHRLADQLDSRASEYEQDVRIVQQLLRNDGAGSGVTPANGQGNIAPHEDTQED